MDFIQNMFNDLGTIPTIACIGVVALLFYSIIKGGKGGCSGTGAGGGRGVGSGSTGTHGSTGVPPAAPPTA